jgi:hypothetical protein
MLRYVALDDIRCVGVMLKLLRLDMEVGAAA